jgi:hypothetical protein
MSTLTHTHAHGHHSHGPAGENPPAGGPAMLDIGGDVGALVVHIDGDVVGHELHVRLDGGDGSTVHTGIWRRAIGDRDEVIALFPELIDGRYEVLDLGGHTALRVTIIGGEIAVARLKLAHP